MQASVSWKIKVRFHGSLSHGIQASVTPAQTFAEKKTARVENVFFFVTRTWARNINKFILVWIVNEMTFPLGSTKISDYAERAEPTLCKNLFKNPDFEEI